MDKSPKVRLIPYQSKFGMETVKMWRASMEAALGIKDEHSWDDQLSYLREIAEKYQVYLAIVDDKGQIVDMMAAGGGELDQFYVDVGCQGRGVGTVLLNKAKKISPGRLGLYTFAVNKGAQSFYEKHGFQIIARGIESKSGMADIRYEWVEEGVLAYGHIH